MQRWKIAILPLLLAGALAAPTSALAQAPSTNFKGKAGFYEGGDHYVVVNFTCSSGILSGNWTYEVSGSQSYSGPLPGSACALDAGTGGTWSTPSSTPIGGPVTSTITRANPSPISGTLALTLTTVTTGKTYIGNTAGVCGGTTPCAEVTFDSPQVASFDSNQGGYATLTLSAH